MIFSSRMKHNEHQLTLDGKSLCSHRSEFERILTRHDSGACTALQVCEIAAPDANAAESQ